MQNFLKTTLFSVGKQNLHYRPLPHGLGRKNLSGIIKRRSSCPLCSREAGDNVAKAEGSVAEEASGPSGREGLLRTVSVPNAVLWSPINQVSLVSKEIALSADLL